MFRLTVCLRTHARLYSTELPLSHNGKCSICFDTLFQGENLVVAVDDDGLFTERITHFSGRYVKDADKDIIEAVKVIIDA